MTSDANQSFADARFLCTREESIWLKFCNFYLYVGECRLRILCSILGDRIVLVSK